MHDAYNFASLGADVGSRRGGRSYSFKLQGRDLKLHEKLNPFTD